MLSVHSAWRRLRDLDTGIRRASVTRVETQDYGDRIWSSRRCRLLQTCRWRGQFYDVAFELLTNDEAKEVVLQTPETTYFAIGVERMAILMGETGFTRVRRIDGCLFQPVLVGSR